MIVSEDMVPRVLGFGDVLVFVGFLRKGTPDLEIALPARCRVHGKRRQQPFELGTPARGAHDRIGVLWSHQLLEHLFTRFTPKFKQWH
jgi:hypothetical protein